MSGRHRLRLLDDDPLPVEEVIYRVRRRGRRPLPRPRALEQIVQPAPTAHPAERRTLVLNEKPPVWPDVDHDHPGWTP